MINFLFTILLSFSNAKEFIASDYCPLIVEIDNEVVRSVIKCLKHKKKLLVISPGGEKTSSDVLIKYVNKNKITVLCVVCNSMAAYLWLQADKKEIYKNAQFMIHYLYIVTDSKPYEFTVRSLRSIADELEKETELYFNKLSKENKNKLIENIKNSKNQEYYFGIDVVNTLNLEFEIIDNPKEKTDAN